MQIHSKSLFIAIKKLFINHKIYRSSVTKLVISTKGRLKLTPIDIVFAEENLNLLRIKSNSLFENDKDLDPLTTVEEYEKEKVTSSVYVGKISLEMK